MLFRTNIIWEKRGRNGHDALRGFCLAEVNTLKPLKDSGENNAHNPIIQLMLLLICFPSARYLVTSKQDCAFDTQLHRIHSLTAHPESLKVNGKYSSGPSKAPHAFFFCVYLNKLEYSKTVPCKTNEPPSTHFYPSCWHPFSLANLWLSQGTEVQCCSNIRPCWTNSGNTDIFTKKDISHTELLVKLLYIRLGCHMLHFILSLKIKCICNMYSSKIKSGFNPF